MGVTGLKHNEIKPTYKSRKQKEPLKLKQIRQSLNLNEDAQMQMLSG